LADSEDPTLFFYTVVAVAKLGLGLVYDTLFAQLPRDAHAIFHLPASLLAKKASIACAIEPTEVADILIDLVQRETRTFSNRFARTLMGEMKNTVRMHKHPLKSAGFRVLKAPDVPSVLVELGYVSNKGDLEHLVSEDWRNKTVGSMAQAIDAFFAKRLAGK